MPNLKRMGTAAGNGVGYALVMWGVFSVLGEPSWMHHHLADVLCWTGIAYACGHFGCKR